MKMTKTNIKKKVKELSAQLGVYEIWEDAKDSLTESEQEFLTAMTKEETK